jgi:phage tail-like protein
LQGSETDGPVIRRVRLDFPRVASLQQLPAVYRESPEAEDFTERFLSLFDAATEDLDRAIERFPALLDPEGVPEEVLPWLGTFLGIVFDARWDADRRRKLLQAAPDLFRRRGTVAGLAKAIELIFGDTSNADDRDGQPVISHDKRPVISERVWMRARGVVNHTARLGAMRVFGKSEARFRVGRSALGVAPLRSYGNPDHDPVRADAHRFTVLIPPNPVLKRMGTDQLERLIESQKPAHTLHSWRVGGQGFILGRLSTVGIDTQLVPIPAPVLGSGEAVTRCRGNVYLSRTSILRPGPDRPMCTFRIGVNAAVGVHTTLE